MEVSWGQVPGICSGDGYGSGDGSGYGYGAGYGSGDGSGYGSGSGDGSGDGDGDGPGSGYGDGDRSALAGFRVLIPAVALSDPRVLALWKSAPDGQPANGGQRGEAARVGLRQRVDGPLELCRPGSLHATLEPWRWKGERLWIVALGGEVIGNAEKMAALDREIIAEGVL